ncbi:MAG: GDP-L-fucose synthase family protein [Bryobacteraceae bacterium]
MIDLARRRVLVTGGGGFLGRHLVERLRETGCENVFAPRRREFDLTRAEAVEDLMRQTRPEVLIHAAAVVGGIGANRANPGLFFYENAIMGIQLIEAARRTGVEKTIVLGTICAYPKFTPVPFREDDLWNGYPEETNAPYGVAKKALLVQCQAYREQYGMNAIYLLPVNLYGPGDNFDLETSHVIPALIRKCVEAVARGEREVLLWGDGSPTREFLYVKDAVEGILAAARCYDKPDPVNLGSGVEISIRALAEKIASLTGFGGSIIWDATKPNGQPRRCLDVTRAEREFGFRAATPLDVGLRETVAWYRATRPDSAR